ncbi:hypothetical protein BJX70DRAFT_398122 [Aspergillus crustosus]
MASVNDCRRDRLEALWSLVFQGGWDRLWRLFDPPEGLGLRDQVIPPNVLAQHGIFLERHSFNLSTTAESNLSLDPPILFEFRSPAIFSQYPIAPEPGDYLYNHAPESYFNLVADTLGRPLRGAEAIGLFVTEWALAGYSRAGLPANTPNLATLCNIAPILSPHPLLPPRPVCDGINWYEREPGNQWLSSLYEYRLSTPTGMPRFPHVILVTSVSCAGEDGSITKGELGALITAMHNRSQQPAVFDEDAAMASDSDDSMEVQSGVDAEDADFAFGQEQRFPVLMLSFLGRRHGRITYACMDGMQIVIRQSQRYRFVDGDCDPSEVLTLFACALLSTPLSETSEQDWEIVEALAECQLGQ